MIGQLLTKVQRSINYMFREKLKWNQIKCSIKTWECRKGRKKNQRTDAINRKQKDGWFLSLNLKMTGLNSPIKSQRLLQ